MEKEKPIYWVGSSLKLDVPVLMIRQIEKNQVS
jgi:hypothetical protein